MSLRYLLDEHVPPALQGELSRIAPDLWVERVGGSEAPALGSPDHDLLRWCEQHDVLLVTNNRKSMPQHLRDHMAGGGHVPGIFIIPRRLRVADVAAELALIADATSGDEHRDQIRYLPIV